MLPAPRKKPNASGQHISSSEQIVQDYLQMKALLSYVGDLVMPFDTSKRTKPGRKNGADMPVDPDRYQEAVKEAVSIWTPLVGVHLPKWLQQKKKPPLHVISTMSQNESVTASETASLVTKEKSALVGNDTASGVYSKELSLPASNLVPKRKPPVPITAPTAPRTVQQEESIASEMRSVLLTKSSLRKVLRDEVISSENSKQSYRK
jgi:hypothetical protein